MENVPYVPFSGGFARRYMFEALAAVFARRYRFFFFFLVFLLGSKTTFLLQITCNNFHSTKTLPQMSPN